MSRSHDSFEVGAGERLAAEIERLIILVRDRFGGDAPSVYNAVAAEGSEVALLLLLACARF